VNKLFIFEFCTFLGPSLNKLLILGFSGSFLGSSLNKLFNFDDDLGGLLFSLNKFSNEDGLFSFCFMSAKRSIFWVCFGFS
jgi:hypothetical protein